MHNDKEVSEDYN